MLQWLTLAERRGAALLVLILLLGAGHDAWVAHRMRAETRAAARPGSAVDPAAPLAREAAADSQARVSAPRPSKLDLNRASAGELESLPGIGPVLARRIVLSREEAGAFVTVEDLLRVRGVGPRLLVRLRPLVSAALESASAARAGTPRRAMHSAASRPERRADSASEKAEHSR